MKVFVGFSGGIDSSVAYLKAKEIFGGKNEIILITAKLNGYEEERAKQTAKLLGADLIIFDLRKKFKEKVIDYTIDTYLKGKTPNPCAVCNKYIKFGAIVDKLNELSKEYIYITGHYADIKDGFLVRNMYAKNQEQSYFLSLVKNDVLKKTQFLLSNIDKTTVIKENKSLFEEIKSYSSNDLCFIKTNLKNFLLEKVGIKKGKVLNYKGEVIGEHDGYFLFTVGQRKGLGRYGKRVYVKRIIPQENLVIVDDFKNVLTKFLEVKIDNLFLDLKDFLSCPIFFIKTRHSQPLVLAKIEDFNFEKNILKLRLAKKQLISPGQLVTFYYENKVLAGGWVENI